MVPFERALLSSHRPLKVTFPPSLRVIAAFVLQNAIFPTPPRLPQISPCSHGSRWIAFWLQSEARVGLIVCVISFQDFQPVITNHQRHRRTDGHCAVKIGLHISVQVVLRWKDSSVVPKTQAFISERCNNGCGLIYPRNYCDIIGCLNILYRVGDESVLVFL